MAIVTPTPSVLAPVSSRDKQPTVVLLHGLLRQGHHMKKLEKSIAEATGWKTHIVEYPSRAFSIKDLAARVAKELQEITADDPSHEVWAVTHSLGGIILRHMMALPNQGGIRWKGICMLAPPNQGSCVARGMRNSGVPLASPIFSKLYGKAGVDLGCELEEGAKWPMPPQPCGIIAGTRSWATNHPVTWFTKAFRFFSGPNDGTVSVEETRLRGVETDFIEVPLQHSDIMWDPHVAELVVLFLTTLKFRKEEGR